VDILTKFLFCFKVFESVKIKLVSKTKTPTKVGVWWASLNWLAFAFVAPESLLVVTLPPQIAPPQMAIP